MLKNSVAFMMCVCDKSCHGVLFEHKLKHMHIPSSWINSVSKIIVVVVIIITIIILETADKYRVSVS